MSFSLGGKQQLSSSFKSNEHLSHSYTKHIHLHLLLTFWWTSLGTFLVHIYITESWSTWTSCNQSLLLIHLARTIRSITRPTNHLYSIQIDHLWLDMSMRILLPRGRLQSDSFLSIWFMAFYNILISATYSSRIRIPGAHLTQSSILQSTTYRFWLHILRFIARMQSV